MIKHRVGEGAGYMADATILVGWNVRSMLASRTTGATVMAAVASITYNFRAGMVDKSAGEINGIVARAAILGCASMDFRIRHTPGPCAHMIHTAIMTGGAITGDSRVIEYRWYEGIVGVADVTILSRRQMAC